MLRLKLKQMPYRHTGRAISSIAAACLCISPALAQNQGEPATEQLPAELLSAQRELASALQSVLAPLNKSYALALRKAERELALAGDYEGAIAARNERIAIEELVVAASLSTSDDATKTTTAATVPAGTPTPSVSPESNVFDAKDATSGVNTTATPDSTRLTATDASLIWKFSTPTARGFSVSVIYSSEGPASFWVRENFFRLKGEVESTSGVWKTVDLGVLKVTSEAEALSLIAIETPADGFAVKQLILTPLPE